MTIDERTRHQLHGRLEEILGPEEAATLMSYLPPVGWADVATKHDLDVIRRDLDELRGDVQDLRREMRRDISGLRNDMGGEIGSLRAELIQLRSDSAAQVRTFMLATSASLLTAVSLAFAAARFA
jgi:hypothetical protein